MAVFYGLVGQVGDGVDRLAADNGGGFMEKLRYEELKAGLRAYSLPLTTSLTSSRPPA